MRLVGSTKKRPPADVIESRLMCPAYSLLVDPDIPDKVQRASGLTSRVSADDSTLNENKKALSEGMRGARVLEISTADIVSSFDDTVEGKVV